MAQKYVKHLTHSTRNGRQRKKYISDKFRTTSHAKTQSKFQQFLDEDYAFGMEADTIDEVDERIGFSFNEVLKASFNISRNVSIEESNTEESMHAENEDAKRTSYAGQSVSYAEFILDVDSGMDENQEYAPYASYSSNNVNEKFPQFNSKFEDNQWIEIILKPKRFFIRKQSRNNIDRCNIQDSDIEIKILVKAFGHVEVTNHLWFHATSWESAIRKMENGPEISEGPLDMAYYGAFYLNPDYKDCYDWFYTRDSKFQGKHAMLIYNFEPEDMSKKGERILNINKWKTLSGERSRPSGKVKDDWIYTYQNANPTRIHKTGDNARARKTRNNQDAMQLIIYTEAMCRKIHQHLIGCVYYENC